MPLISDTDLETIELPAEGEWVKIKTHLSRGDEVAVQRAVLRGARAPVSAATTEANFAGSIDVEAAYDAGEVALLEIVIKEWSFDVPVNPRNIRTLDPASVEAIEVACDAQYPPMRTVEADGPLGGNGQTPISDVDPIPLNSPGSS